MKLKRLLRMAGAARSTAILLLLFICLRNPTVIRAQLWTQTTFMLGAEGWIVINWNGTGNPTQPDWYSAGGNPGGYLRSGDVHGDGFWQAPDSFLGDWSAAYGGRLGYDAFANYRDWKMNDVYLAGTAGTLSYWFSDNPMPAWTGFSVALEAGAGWQFGWNYDTIGTPATEAQIRQVLASVTNVLIRQEYAWGTDDSGLDNVVLFLPAYRPTLADATRTGTNFGFSFQTVSNLTYTIEFNNDLGTTNWQFLQTITGDGSIKACSIPMTNGLQRFFRVRRP